MPTGGRRHHDDGVEVYRKLPDSPVTAFPFGPITQSLNVIPSNGIIVGWSAVETTGTASAAFDIVDGADDSGTLLQPVTLQAGQSSSDDFTSWGMWLQRGARIKMISGSVRGSLAVILPGETAGR